MKKLALIVAASVLLVGCGSNNTATPKTVTVTETPAPVTVTETPAPVAVTETPAPVTVTKTVTKTPQSCLDAITSAEQFGLISGQFAHTVTAYPQMIQDAFQAGLEDNTTQAADVLSRLRQSTAEIKRENRLMGTAVSHFNTAKAACRSN